MPRPRLTKRALRWTVLLAAFALVAVVGCLGVAASRGLWTARLVQQLPDSFTIPGRAPQLPWPQTGQAAVAVGGAGLVGETGPVQTPQPIASVAKVLTAYQVLQDHPLGPLDQGPTVTVLPQEAAAYADEVRADESLVPVSAGEQLTERQALEALLLASADNVAQILGRWDAGSVPAFLDKENRTAAALGMAHSHYTDPSGLDAGTVSTAPDQLLLDETAMRLPALAGIVDEQQANLPVAGAIENFNRLLGRDGVVGVKTGSTTAAGGCLMFAAEIPVGGPVAGSAGTGTTTANPSGRKESTRTVGAGQAVGAVRITENGRTAAGVGQPGGAAAIAHQAPTVTISRLVPVYGVVLGQPGHPWQILPAALTASDRLLSAVRSVLTSAVVVPAGHAVGTVHQTWHDDRPVTTAADVDVIGWPGLSYTVTVGGPVGAPKLTLVPRADPADQATLLLRE